MPDTLLRGFNFRVTLLRAAGGPSVSAFGAERNQPAGTALGDGGFQECTGLEVSMDVQELLEGGRNNGVVKRVGRAKYQPLVLKRGMFHPEEEGSVNRALWGWLQDVVNGVRPVARYGGIVEVLDRQGERDDATVLAKWRFDRGLPLKVAGPQLNARTGEIAIEELHVAHEGLRLVAP